MDKSAADSIAQPIKAGNSYSTEALNQKSHVEMEMKQNNSDRLKAHESKIAFAGKQTTFPVMSIPNDVTANGKIPVENAALVTCRAESKEDFRKAFVSGLWSLSPFKLHIADASTNTSEDSGYDTPVACTNACTRAHKSCSHAKDNQPIYQTISDLSPSTSSTVPPSGSGSSCTSDADSPDSLLLDHRLVIREDLSIGSPYKTGDNVSVAALQSANADVKTDWMVDLPDYGSDGKSLSYSAVVAIDIGTSFSCYSYALPVEDNCDAPNVFLMRHLDQSERFHKCPTCLLLCPDGRFHSFGSAARDFYQNLTLSEARHYLYFENFKADMVLGGVLEPRADCFMEAANGQIWPLAELFLHAFQYFKNAALFDVSGHLGRPVSADAVRWVITVPPVWSKDSKNFIRQAAYQAGLGMMGNREQILLASECQVSGLWCRQFYSDTPLGSHKLYSVAPKIGNDIDRILLPGDSYVVVDCGAGSVRASVLQVQPDGSSVLELNRIPDGPRGDLAIDLGFEVLLCDIFSADFIKEYRIRFSSSWIDLMSTFRQRKLSCSPFKLTPINIALPASFLDFHRKFHKTKVERTLKRHKSPNVSWDNQGMLRLESKVIQGLFKPVITSIIDYLNSVLAGIPSIVLSAVKGLFIVGGFAESQYLQSEIKKHFSARFQIAIPDQPRYACAKGAVLLGLRPECLSVRHSSLSYGIGVLHRFDPSTHPFAKRLVKDQQTWCLDVFDPFILAGDEIVYGGRIARRYYPASGSQHEIVLQIYCTENAFPKFVTEPGVEKCGELRLSTKDVRRSAAESSQHVREIVATMEFGHTSIVAIASDLLFGTKSRCEFEIKT